MDIRQIEFFITAADSRSFTKAAEQLFISRQALARNITALEGELGKPLMIRKSDGLILTEYGRIFRAYAGRLLGTYQNALFDLNNFDQDRKQTSIRFGLPTGAWKYYETFFDSFVTGHPDVSLLPQSLSDADLLPLFGGGDYDFVMTTDPNLLPQYRYHFLGRTYRCLSVPRSHPLAERSFIRTRDLQGLTISVPDLNSYDYFWLKRICDREGVQPNIFINPDSLTQYHFSEGGRATTLTIPDLRVPSPVTALRRNLFWCPEELEESALNLHVVTRRDTDLPPLLSELIRHLERCYREMIASADYYPFCRDPSAEKGA